MPDAAIPQTGDYLLLALVVVAVLLIGFVGLLALRFRNLRRDLEALESLAEE